MAIDNWVHQVATALDSLDPTDRRAVGLIYFEQYSYAEAASRLGVTGGAINDALRRGLHAVARAVELGGVVVQGSVA